MWLLGRVENKRGKALRNTSRRSQVVPSIDLHTTMKKQHKHSRHRDREGRKFKQCEIRHEWMQRGEDKMSEGEEVL